MEIILITVKTLPTLICQVSTWIAILAILLRNLVNVTIFLYEMCYMLKAVHSTASILSSCLSVLFSSDFYCIHFVSGITLMNKVSYKSAETDVKQMVAGQTATTELRVSIVQA